MISKNVPRDKTKRRINQAANMVQMVITQYHRGLIDAALGQATPPANCGRLGHEAWLQGFKDGKKNAQTKSEIKG